MLKNKVWPIALGLIGLVTVSSAAYAKEEVTHEYQFTVTADTELVIENSVGEVEFVRGEDNEIHVELTIKSTEDGWFYGGGDINAVSLVDHWRGNELNLSLEPDEDIQAHWVVTLPKMSRVDVEMGVGEIHGDLLTTDSSFDLGVGEIDLTLYGEDISRISADVGIGESTIDGFKGGRVETSRAVVSSESRADGSGNYRISADVGVGEVNFTVRGLN